MDKKHRELIGRINVAKHLCHAAFGPEHHWSLKYGASCVIMLLGVLIAKTGGNIHSYGLHYLFDLIGYGVHGLGAVPFIERIVELFHEPEGEEVPWPAIDIALLDEGEEGLD